MTGENPQTGRESCYFCHDTHTELLETHHIVPRRYGGSDDESNLVDLCPNCHRKIEWLYDSSFYAELDVEDIEEDETKQEPLADISPVQKQKCRQQIKDEIRQTVADTGEGPQKDELVSSMRERGFEGQIVNEMLDQLKNQGEVYNDFSGGFKTT